MTARVHGGRRLGAAAGVSKLLIEWIEFVGTEGAVMVDDTHRDVYVTSMRDGIRFPISTMPGGKVNHVYAGLMDAETLHFLECVATGTQPLVTAEPTHGRQLVLWSYFAGSGGAGIARY